MDEKYMQAAYQSLMASGQFGEIQSLAIARAIESAILQIGFQIQALPHTHPELEKRLPTGRDEKETQKSSH